MMILNVVYHKHFHLSCIMLNGTQPINNDSKRGKVMKKTTVNKGGRRTEMNVRLGAKTVERFKRLYAENDYSLIAGKVTPPTTKATVSKHLNGAVAKEDWTMPESIAKAAQAFYANKDKTQKALAA